MPTPDRQTVKTRVMLELQDSGVLNWLTEPNVLTDEQTSNAIAELVRLVSSLAREIDGLRDEMEEARQAGLN